MNLSKGQGELFSEEDFFNCSVTANKGVSFKKYEIEEWQNRIDLAAAYHLADIYGFSDIIWNHITCKTSSKKKFYLGSEGSDKQAP